MSDIWMYPPAFPAELFKICHQKDSIVDFLVLGAHSDTSFHQLPSLKMCLIPQMSTIKPVARAE